MKRRTTQPPAFTIAKFCQHVGCDRHTLSKAIEEMQIAPTGEATAQGAPEYRMRDLCRAFAGGDIEAEKLRKCREEADRLALANSRSRGELVEVASVKKLGERVMIAIRSTILNMPLTDEEKDRLLLELMALGKIDWTRGD